jgi:single-strand DNA-binding protein
MNHLSLKGNLVAEPEIRTTQTGTTIGKFTVAHTNVTVSKGEKKEETSFIDCTAFGKNAENIAKYFSKGSEILLEGRVKVVVMVDRFHFTKGSRGGSQQQSGGQQQNTEEAPPF